MHSDFKYIASASHLGMLALPTTVSITGMFVNTTFVISRGFYERIQILSFVEW